MPYFSFEDQKTFFTISKALNGVPLVLIHGAGGNHLSWPPNMRHTLVRPVIAVDLPGHWQSKGAGCSNLADYVRAVVTLLDELSIPQALIGGHSMGGAIAQMMALQHPVRVLGLILVGTGARLRVSSRILNGIHADFARTIDLIMDWAFAPNANDDLVRLFRQRMLDVSPDVLYGDFVACNKFDVLGSIKHWEGPTIVICGELDQLTPEKHSRYLAGQITDAILEIVPRAGHMVMLERPEVVGSVVNKFMAEIV